MSLLLDINVSESVVVSVVGGLLILVGVLVGILHNDLKLAINSQGDELRKSVDAIHADLAPLKVEVAVHREKIQKVEQRVDIIYERQINDNRDIQALQIKTSHLKPI